MARLIVTSIAVFAALAYGCAPAADDQEAPAIMTEQDLLHGPTNVAVDLPECVESIGVGLVATERARPLVPPQFLLAGEGQPVTPFVARTSRCGGIAVAGHAAEP